jgi:hypothetical protein
MTSKLETAVRKLFEAYGRSADAAVRGEGAVDVDSIVSSFAPYFVASSPRGVMGGENGETFRELVPKGFQHYREVGGKAMTLVGLSVEPLDTLHAIARVDWDFRYINKAGKSGHVAFTNLYFVTTASGEPKIFAYVTPDEQGAMEAHGLV